MCFATFWESEIYPTDPKCEIDDILEIEDLSHFFIDELKVLYPMVLPHSRQQGHNFRLENRKIR